MSYEVRCFPVKPIKICEGGWQVPEVLRSSEPCETPEITGNGDLVEVYCTTEQLGSNLVLSDTINTTTIASPSNIADSIDISTYNPNQNITYNTIKWIYNVEKDENTRAGEILATFTSDSVSFVDTSTTDVGDTHNISFDVVVEGSVIKLIIVTTESDWNIKVHREHIL